MKPFWKKKANKENEPTLSGDKVDPARGLNEKQVSDRVAAGLQNLPIKPPTRTKWQIIRSNVFTYFNLIFILLAVALFLVRASIFNFSFLLVVVINAVIGIAQEMKSKKVLDELNILQAPQANVVRSGQVRRVPTEELVRDDVVEFSAGEQVYADALILTGGCMVNEALITGEADEVHKHRGESLLSGSYLVSGTCRARLTAVGAEAYVNRLTLEAKKQKKAARKGMMHSLNLLVKVIGIILIPLAAALVYKEVYILERPLEYGVTSTVGTLVGMVPEGLFFLTSLALATGVRRLAKRKTMVRDLGCIETLARVDTLCVDKTGTITESKMVVEDIIPLSPDLFSEEDIRLLMADYVHAMQGDNATMAALRKYFRGHARQKAQESLPFSPDRKYGGVCFKKDETYLLGAPEVLMGVEYTKYYQEMVDKYSSQGCRVVLLCMYDGQLSDPELTSDRIPIALLLLANKVRDEALDTFAYFAKQGVEVRVISGDNPLTVSEVARSAGIPGAERYVDARTLLDDEALADAARDCVVFGRVTPEQKRKLVLALKEQGHTVAMTGDGVNDVLALKEADCSIAMASGSEVACQVSQIVLLESNFASMPSVVAEGRRVVNNIERSASLYLVKNIFSIIVAVLGLIFALPNPLSPAQLGLVNGLTIGFPSFILAMEPNEERIQGHFLRNILYRALPAALTDVLLVEFALLFYLATGMPDQEMSTICSGLMALVGLIMVFHTSLPLNTLRKVMLSIVTVGLLVCYFCLQTIFTLVPLHFLSALILVTLGLLAWPAFSMMGKLSDWCRDNLNAAIAQLRDFWNQTME